MLEAGGLLGADDVDVDGVGAGEVVVVGGGVVVDDGWGALVLVRVGLADALADALGLGVGDADRVGEV